MAMGDRGLACPVSFSDCFPEPSDFSAGAFHTRSAHKRSIHQPARCAPREGGLSPLSTEPLAERAGSQALLL